MPRTKIINGKEYTFFKRYTQLDKAETAARQLRKMGKNARVEGTALNHDVYVR